MRTWPCAYCEKQIDIDSGGYVLTNEFEQLPDGRSAQIIRWVCLGCISLFDLEFETAQDMIKRVKDEFGIGGEDSRNE